MSAAAFDTHAAVKTLREAGADEAMAEAIVNTASAAAGADREQLATKADLNGLESRVGAKLAALEARLTWRLVGLAAVIVAAVKLIPGLD